MTTDLKKIKPGRPRGTKVVRLSTTLPPELKDLFHKLGGAEWLKNVLKNEELKTKRSL